MDAVAGDRWTTGRTSAGGTCSLLHRQRRSLLFLPFLDPMIPYFVMDWTSDGRKSLLCAAWVLPHLCVSFSFPLRAPLCACGVARASSSVSGSVFVIQGCALRLSISATTGTTWRRTLSRGLFAFSPPALVLSLHSSWYSGWYRLRQQLSAFVHQHNFFLCLFNSVLLRVLSSSSGSLRLQRNLSAP